MATLALRHTSSHRLKIVAIIAAYNEADIIRQSVGALVQEGIAVYLLDQHSTDGTAAAVSDYLNRGLLNIERFPASEAAAAEFSLERIVQRKQELAKELEADWFINHDADEFRESPRAGLTFRQGIEWADRLGYNAIDFEVLNFWPTHDGFRPDVDVRETFHHFTYGETFNRVQIRCWKNTPAPLDLVSTAGHEARFPGRLVFPIRFLLRHYPIRSQAHGMRKVFVERRPRFSVAERNKGWHVQYDAMTEQQQLLRDPSTMMLYDPEGVRRQVIDRMLEEQLILTQTADAARLELTIRQERVGALQQELAAAHQQLELARHEIALRDASLAGLRETMAARQTEIGRLQQELDAQCLESDTLQQQVLGQRREINALKREVELRRTGVVRAE